MSKHTPGIILQPLVPHGWRFLDADGIALAEVYNIELACLLAAAPEMLELLKLAVEADSIADNSTEESYAKWALFMLSARDLVSRVEGESCE